MTAIANKVLVVGASGGSGRATVDALLAQGHVVTAFARHAHRLQSDTGRLIMIDGDVMHPEDLDAAVAGQDAVIVTLGISESAVRVRLLGSSSTPLDVRSAGTRNVIAAMHRHGVRRLVVQSSYGVGDTRQRLPLLYRAMFKLLLQPQIADTERQEAIVRASGLEWVLAQPVNLTDEADQGDAFASPAGEVRGMKVSRKRVGRFLARAAEMPELAHHSFALSA